MAGVFSNIGEWINERAPGLMPMYRKHMTEYYAPKNFNFMYYMGSLALLVLVNQILTGIFLTMNYNPSAAGAFASVEYIMRDVEWGWLIRYMHTTGASMFFVVIYLHMFRGLMYGSYKKPRELVWLLGMLIFLVLMAEAFMGYVLPWGNMSFWGAKVIISLFGAIPWVGDTLVTWIMGDYLPADATLNRFFALHVIALPLVLLLLVVLHLGALHEVGSNNPDGVEIKKVKGANGKPLDGIPFHPYYTLKDLVGVGFFLIICAFIIFYAPTFGGWFLEHDNFIPANNLATPEHIKPVWYFTPFYAILRMIPAKLPGVLTMFASIVLLFLVPWIDRGKVKSIRYRGLGYKVALIVFVIAFLALGAVGAGVTGEQIPHLFGAGADVTSIENLFGRIMTVLYFGFFAFLWAYTYFGWEKTKPVPDRVTTHD
ncbi:MAG TPA: cytochrome bc complex cytochrome b subunit [Rhodanobacteraceae bacterium]|nr:cytochrome bc complex cytochrome b subunit [Rhodanobacteraceae bacterium]